MVAGVTQVVRSESPPGRENISHIKMSTSGSSRSWVESRGGDPAGTRVKRLATASETLGGDISVGSVDSGASGS